MRGGEGESGEGEGEEGGSRGSEEGKKKMGVDGK